MPSRVVDADATRVLAEGLPVGQIVRKLGVSEQTHYRWRREYGAMRVDQAKRLGHKGRG